MTTCNPQPRMSNAAWRGFLARHPGWHAPRRSICALSPAPHSAAAGTASAPLVPMSLATAAVRSLRAAAIALGGTAAAVGTGAAAYAAGGWLAGPWSGASSVVSGTGGHITLASPPLGQTLPTLTTGSPVPVPEPSTAALLLLPLAVLALCSLRRGARHRA
jgi:hypothetical protein